MIQISKPIITTKDIKSVVSVLKSGALVQGKMVKQLEHEFSEICGSTYARAMSNGTSALHTALHSLGITSGDEVITPAFTFIASVNAILMVGAVPVFVDIDEKTFNIDVEKIQSAITKKTKAILAVNLFGQPCDFTTLSSIAKKNNLYIVEDAAQSVNANYKSKKSGNLADISCFSFYATKNILSGEGGMITTNNKKYAETAELFRQHGEKPGKKYEYFGLGYNYRMTDIQAALALSQLQRLQNITKRRQELANIYFKQLANIKGIILPYVDPSCTSVFHQFTIRVTNEFSKTRDALKELLEQQGIITGIYYPIPLHKVAHLQQYLKKDTRLSVTENISSEVLSLPIHPKITKSDIAKIATIIKSV